MSDPAGTLRHPAQRRHHQPAAGAHMNDPPARLDTLRDSAITDPPQAHE
jgi:hypothetical protein